MLIVVTGSGAAFRDSIGEAGFIVFWLQLRIFHIRCRSFTVIMLRQFALVSFLSGLVFSQAHTPIARFNQLDEITKVDRQVPEGFGCAILWDVDLPARSDIIASVVGGVVHQISVILEHTMYTVVYEPPLPRDDRLRKKARVPARVVGENLIIRWMDGTDWKGRIVKREKIDPNRPQPA